MIHALYLGIDCDTRPDRDRHRDRRRHASRRLQSIAQLRSRLSRVRHDRRRHPRRRRQVYAPPAMWADALDRMLARLAQSAEVDVDNIRAISGSAQQHGSVYLNRARAAASGGRSIPPRRSRRSSRRSSRDRTRRSGSMRRRARSAGRSTHALGGADRVAALTGSPACERFTGPQIRKFAQSSRRHTPTPRACISSARIWRRCSPARTRRSIPATAPA